MLTSLLNLRLIPVVIFAAGCLLAIKTTSLVQGSGEPTALFAADKGLWQRITSKKEDDIEITGATPEAKPPPSGPPPMAALPKSAQAGNGQVPGAASAGGTGSPSERALIERLQERRQDLDARTRDLQMRESLIKAAEKRLENRIEELKELEGKGSEATARLKNLVIMYEAMSPKDAAKIFDRLEMKTLVDVINQMNPRKVSQILALMKPESAERLTLELANRRVPADKALPPGDLKRVEAKNPG